MPGRRTRAAFVARHGFPLIAKPRRGYASLDVYLLWNARQLDHALDVEHYVVQQFLGDPAVLARFLADNERRGVPLHHTFQGLKHSIQALIAPDGAIPNVICTRNISRRRRSKWVEPDDSADARDIGERCAAAFAAEGWRGPLNIQCQRAHDGTLLIHEFNGRFTGATVDRWLLGFDEVGAAIEQFTGDGPARQEHRVRRARSIRIAGGTLRRSRVRRGAGARRRVAAAALEQQPRRAADCRHAALGMPAAGGGCAQDPSLAPTSPSPPEARSASTTGRSIPWPSATTSWGSRGRRCCGRYRMPSRAAAKAARCALQSRAGCSARLYLGRLAQMPGLTRRDDGWVKPERQARTVPRR